MLVMMRCEIHGSGETQTTGGVLAASPATGKTIGIWMMSLCQEHNLTNGLQTNTAVIEVDDEVR